MRGPTARLPPREVQHERLALWAKLFVDTILFTDDPALLQTFRDRGFTTEFERGRLAILRPQDCRSDVIVKSSGERPALVVRAGRVGLEHATLESKIPALRDPPPEGERLGFPDCGQMWIHIESADGTLSCREADAAGRLYARSTPEEPGLAYCELPPVPAAP